jgi:hypothetical protein
MAVKPSIVFKCEASLWDMLNQRNPDGTSAKPFDMRRWNLADERIKRLAWGTTRPAGKFLRSRNPPHQYERFPNQQFEYGSKWSPDEKEVSFLNKATGELLTFEYLGVEFTDWAPGWGFLILGKRH